MTALRVRPTRPLDALAEGVRHFLEHGTLPAPRVPGRARAFALIYALPVAILGGSTQLVVTWLLEVTQSPMSIAWYLTGVSLIGFFAMLALKESAPIKLGLAKPG